MLAPRAIGDGIFRVLQNFCEAWKTEELFLKRQEIPSRVVAHVGVVVVQNREDDLRERTTILRQLLQSRSDLEMSSQSFLETKLLNAVIICRNSDLCRYKGLENYSIILIDDHLQKNMSAEYVGYTRSLLYLFVLKNRIRK